MPITLTQLSSGSVEATGANNRLPKTYTGTSIEQTAEGIRVYERTEQVAFFHSLASDPVNGVNAVVDDQGSSTAVTTASQLYEAAKSLFSVGGAGGVGAGFVVPNSASIPFADVAARNTWAAANLGDLVQNQTVVSVSGSPDTWYLWRGASNPASHDPNDWIDATPLIRGPAGSGGVQVLGPITLTSTQATNGVSLASATSVIMVVGDGVILTDITLSMGVVTSSEFMEDMEVIIFYS